MRFSITLSILLSFSLLKAYAQPPNNDDIENAQPLTSIIGYCSSEGEYSNIGASASKYQKARFWLSAGKDIWYKFTALRTDITIAATGKSDNTSINTLINPLIAIYTYDGISLSEMIGSMSTSNNTTKAYKGGLIIGKEYYLRISAEANATGTFKLCVNNYNPPTKPGQDCSTASTLCNKENVSEINITGAGNNNREAAGTCLETESNTAWYKWTAANNGTLTFSITPNLNTDDIDWVLYDLGVNGDCAQVTAANAIRCAVGNGINCSPSYFVTGLNETSTDLTEQKNCPPGQDGWLKYVDMVEGHTYVLLIDNYSSGDNGFILAFGGTGEFKGPKTEVAVTKNNPCTPQQSYTFSAGTGNYSTLMWNFGEGASMADATTPGPHLINYSTNGQKNITLEATNAIGCAVITYYNLHVALKPSKPDILASKMKLCIDDVLKLSTPDVEGASYHWSGPNGFTSDKQDPEIKVTGPENAGDYTLTLSIGECESETSLINIPPIPQKAVAAFNTDPAFEAKYSIPATVRFINQSRNADRYHWDFGDNTYSNETSPTHTYTTEGTFNITLTAFTENDCSYTAVKGNLVILKEGTLLVPGAFSPNGDGVNDEFKISIANLKNFHLSVINRWGVKVFESYSMLRNWDGRHNAMDVPAGVYFYVIIGKTLVNEHVKYSGSITVLR